MYKGATEAEVLAGTRNTIDHWARHGLAGRAALQPARSAPIWPAWCRRRWNPPGVWVRSSQPAEAAPTAARIASSSPSNGSLPSMRSPLT